MMLNYECEDDEAEEEKPETSNIISGAFTQLVSTTTNCLACDFPITPSNGNIARQKLCQACKKFFYRHSLKEHERLATAPCMCKFKVASSPTSSTYSSVQQLAAASRSHAICKSCRYRRCLTAGVSDDKTIAGFNTSPRTATADGGEASSETNSGGDHTNGEQVAELDVTKLPCAVCGYLASGVHFGAVSCDACKAFYGRFARRCQLAGDMTADGNSLLAMASAQGGGCCLTGGHCFDKNSDCNNRISQNRMRCSTCRIAKCIAVGMSPYGSVAGRRSQAQKRAITEAVKQYFKADMPLAKLVTKSAEDHQPAATTSSQHHQHRSSISSISSSSSSGGESTRKILAVVAPSKMRDKYSELVETVRNKSNNGNSMDVIWLYNSGSTRINLRKLEELSCSSLPSHIDPINLFERFIANPPPPSPYSSQLSLESGKRVEWLVGRVVEATKHLSKMSQERCFANESMGPMEIWRSVLDNFVYCFKCALQFVRALPGFDWLDNVNDRILLFTNALFPILVLQISVDYDQASQKAYIFNLEKESAQIAKRKFAIVARAEPVIRDSGISLKNASLNLAEFGLVGGLLFFNDQVNGLEDPSKVKQMADDYLQAAKMIVNQSSPPLNTTHRLNVITLQVRVFGHYSQLMLRLMEMCRLYYPTLAGVEPLLEEVTGQLAKIHISTPTEAATANNLKQSTFFQPYSINTSSI